MTTFQVFFQLISKSVKRKLYWQFGFILISMVLEMFNIGVILPVVQIISGSNSSNPSLMNLFAKIEIFQTKKFFIIGLSIAIMVIFLVKTLILSFISYKQANFIYFTQAELSKKLFSSYLYRPYSFYLSNNTSHLIKNTITVVSQVTLSMISTMIFVSEIFVLLGLFVYLLILEPIGTLYISILLISFSMIFYFISKKRIVFYGKSYQLNEGNRIQHLQQGFSAIKEIKISRKEAFFIDKYDIYNQLSAKAGQFQQTLQSLPRLFLEMIAITSLFLLIIYFSYFEYPVENYVPIMTIFGFAAFRMLPSFNRVLNSLQNISYAKPAFEILKNNILQQEDNESLKAVETIPVKKEIEIRNVSFCYDDSQTKVLSKVSFIIPYGSSVAFIGKTGSGKSTMMDLLLGLIIPTHGEILIDNINLDLFRDKWRNSIGYVPQNIYLLDETILSNIAFGINENEINHDTLNSAIEMAQLKSFINTLPDGLKTKVGERGIKLSGGQKQRIGIARALYNKPSILFMDEATSALDAVTENDLISAINSLKGKITIVLIAHRKTVFENCDIIIDFSKINK